MGVVSRFMSSLLCRQTKIYFVIYATPCRLFVWKGLFHIRESEAYLSMVELLYNVIAVYIIAVLTKTSVKFESHYNLLAISWYLSASFKIQVPAFAALC